jgi:hypothetical protein
MAGRSPRDNGQHETTADPRAERLAAVVDSFQTGPLLQ